MSQRQTKTPIHHEGGIPDISFVVAGAFQELKGEL